MSGALEIRGPADGPLDEPLELSARGLGAGEAIWRARLRDDDGRVWRAVGTRPENLWQRWAPAKPGGAPPFANLRSLRPASIDVRVEAADGRAAARTITRHLVGPGVRVRRWRDLRATLFLPSQPRATLVVPGEAELAAPLLASRGAIVLAGEAGDAALERLAAVPGAGAPVGVGELPLPPGVPAVDADPRRVARWAQVLGRLG